MLQFTKPRKLSIVRIRSPHHLFEEKHLLLTPQGPTHIRLPALRMPERVSTCTQTSSGEDSTHCIVGISCH